MFLGFRASLGIFTIRTMELVLFGETELNVTYAGFGFRV